MIPQQVIDSFVPIRAGLFASLVHTCILSNPKLGARCTTVEPEEFGTDSDDTTKTEVPDTLCKTSGTTTAAIHIPHPIHTAYRIYYYTQH